MKATARRWDHSSQWPRRRRNRAAHQRSSCGHKVYHLTCEEFGALELDAGGCCGVCRRTAGAALNVDHDHTVGARAIRGMVCPSCNRLLADVDAGTRQPDRSMLAYLAEPWYRRVGIDGACPAGCTVREHVYARRRLTDSAAE